MVKSNLFKNALFSIAGVFISALFGVGAGLFVSSFVFNFSSSDLIATDSFETSLTIIGFIVGTLSAALMCGFLVSSASKKGGLFLPIYGLLGVLVFGAISLVVFL